MEDHPVFGVVLFVIGTVLLALAYYGSDPAVPQFLSIAIGHIFVLNGVLFAGLGYRKAVRMQRRNRVPR